MKTTNQGALLLIAITTLGCGGVSPSTFQKDDVNPPEGCLSKKYIYLQAYCGANPVKCGYANEGTDVRPFYLSAYYNDGPGSDIRAIAPWKKGWERFTLCDVTSKDDGPRVGDHVYLQTWTGQFLFADRYDGVTLTARKPPDEGIHDSQFKILSAKLEYGRTHEVIQEGDAITLEAEDTHFIAADHGGGGDVLAEWAHGDQWETLTVSYQGDE
jgi:hypothetical protein